MAWLLSIPMVALVLFLVVGAITGRMKVQSCCAVVDPRRDARMREAFVEADDVERQRNSP